MSDSPLLSVQGVVKSFGDVRAVDGVGFEVRRGEVFGFLGPNGAGKTTTLRMIMGITRPDAGSVAFEGGPRLDRRRVGYLPEERGLYEDAAVLDTLVYLGTLRGMSPAAARAAALQWLGRLDLADRAKEKVTTLSKGMQQKLQFAGAVLHRPSLAVLDEPFSGLDPLNQELFISLIDELRREGAAVLLSAHQLDLVERLCDGFYLIARGRGLLHGTLEEIRRAGAGGAGEVLVVDARGDGGPEGLARAARSAAPGAEVQASPGLNGAARVELSLPSGTDLSPVLAALSAHFTIERVEMRALSLHEIYVRAVRRDQGAAAAEVSARA
jgi:ABC-2 type transport system ATP-binding protein